jgi:class 3 adenylate cyclase
MLSEFYERMAARIFACGVAIEKYIGDAFFAHEVLTELLGYTSEEVAALANVA